jgi:hypothetical protein
VSEPHTILKADVTIKRNKKIKSFFISETFDTKDKRKKFV